MIAGVLVVLAAVTASTYVVAEETANIVFRTRSTEVSLPLLTSQAEADAYRLANAFFEVKAGHFPAIPRGLLAEVPGTDVVEAPLDLGAVQPDATADHLHQSIPDSGEAVDPANPEPPEPMPEAIIEPDKLPLAERRETSRSQPLG